MQLIACPMYLTNQTLWDETSWGQARLPTNQTLWEQRQAPSENYPLDYLETEPAEIILFGLNLIYFLLPLLQKKYKPSSTPFHREEESPVDEKAHAKCCDPRPLLVKEFVKKRGISTFLASFFMLTRTIVMIAKCPPLISMDSLNCGLSFLTGSLILDTSPLADKEVKSIANQLSCMILRIIWAFNISDHADVKPTMLADFICGIFVILGLCLTYRTAANNNDDPKTIEPKPKQPARKEWIYNFVFSVLSGVIANFKIFKGDPCLSLLFALIIFVSNLAAMYMYVVKSETLRKFLVSGSSVGENFFIAMLCTIYRTRAFKPENLFNTLHLALLANMMLVFIVEREDIVEKLGINRWLAYLLCNKKKPSSLPFTPLLTAAHIQDDDPPPPGLINTAPSFHALLDRVGDPPPTDKNTESGHKDMESPDFVATRLFAGSSISQP